MDGIVFYIALVGSVLYLATLFLLLVVSTYYQPNVDEGVFLRTTSFWLAPLQAVDSAALGILFVKHSAVRRSGGKPAGVAKTVDTTKKPSGRHKAADTNGQSKLRAAATTSTLV